MTRTPEVLKITPVFDYDSEGYAISDGLEYQSIAPDENGRLWVKELDLWLELVDGVLRFFDPVKGEYLRTPAEAFQFCFRLSVPADHNEEIDS